jgi:hypothetical protein
MRGLGTKEAAMARFKLFPRYRRPSLKTALGITRAKRQMRTVSGYYMLTRPLRATRNFKRRMLRRAGYYSGPMKFLRFLSRATRSR